jgi:hypothetical protein
MVNEYKGRIKDYVKIGALFGFGFGMILGGILKPKDMGNLEFILRTSVGATGSAGIFVLCGIEVYRIDRRLHEIYSERYNLEDIDSTEHN